MSIPSPTATARPPLRLTLTGRLGRAHHPFLRRNLLATHRLLRTPLRDLSLALVNDATMSSLHRQFLSIEGPTDVLTFPLETDSRGRTIMGEVVVCVSEARRMARLHRTRLEHELLLYAIHGLLHLSGFDDRTAKAFNRMHAMEDRLLTRLGVGPVFRTKASR